MGICDVVILRPYVDILDGSGNHVERATVALNLLHGSLYPMVV